MVAIATPLLESKVRDGRSLLSQWDRALLAEGAQRQVELAIRQGSQRYRSRRWARVLTATDFAKDPRGRCWTGIEEQGRFERSSTSDLAAVAVNPGMHNLQEEACSVLARLQDIEPV